MPHEANLSPSPTQALYLIPKKQAISENSPNFREQAEAWLAEVVGEEMAAFMVDRPRG